MSVGISNKETIDTSQELSYFDKKKQEEKKKKKNRKHPWLYRAGMTLLFVFLIYLLWPLVQNWQEIATILQNADDAILFFAAIIFCFNMLIRLYATITQLNAASVAEKASEQNPSIP